ARGPQRSPVSGALRPSALWPDFETPCRRGPLVPQYGPQALAAGLQARSLGRREGDSASGPGRAGPDVGLGGVEDGDPPGLAAGIGEEELLRGSREAALGAPGAARR